MRAFIVAAGLVLLSMPALADTTTINRYTETICKGYRHNRICERQSETVIETPKRRPPAEPLHTMEPSASPRFLVIAPAMPR